MSKIMKGPGLFSEPPKEYIPQYSPTSECYYNPNTGEVVDPPPLPQSAKRKARAEAMPLKQGKGLRVKGTIGTLSSRPGEDTAVVIISLDDDPDQHIVIRVPHKIGTSLINKPLDIIITPSEITSE